MANGDNYEQLLEQELRDKLEQRRRQADPEYQKMVREGRDSLSGRETGNLLRGMSQAASKIGTLGGREAGSSIPAGVGQYEAPAADTDVDIDPRVMKYLSDAKRGRSQDSALAEHRKGQLDLQRNKAEADERYKKSMAGARWAGVNLQRDKQDALLAGGGKGSPKLNEGMRRAAELGRLAESGNTVTTQMEDKGYDPTSMTRWMKEGIPFSEALRNIARSPEDRKYMNGQKAFIAAYLRKTSGAVVTDEEFATWGPIFYPLPGDGPEDAARKAEFRQQTIAGLKGSAGAAWDQIPTMEHGSIAERRGLGGGDETGGFEDTAIADEGPAQVSDSYMSEAEQWARANPGDPRATQILERLGQIKGQGSGGP